MPSPENTKQTNIVKQCKQNISSLRESTLGFMGLGLFIEAAAAMCPCHGTHIDLAAVGSVAFVIAAAHGWDWAKAYDELQEMQKPTPEKNNSEYLFV